MPQLLVTAGTCAGYFTCYATIKIPNQWQWRLPFVIQVAGGAVLALACLLLPKSPRWLLLNGEPQVALRNLKKLDLAENELHADSDVSLAGSEEADATHTQSQPHAILSWRAVVDLFRKKYRFRTTLALFILGMVQLCGIDGVLYVRKGTTCVLRKTPADSTTSTLRHSLSKPASQARQHLSLHLVSPQYLCSQSRSLLSC